MSQVMKQAEPVTLPDVFEGRRGSKGGDRSENDDPRRRNKNYVYCGVCGKVILRESLNKHQRDVHEKSNKVDCEICGKTLSGAFSLREHVNAVHKKQTRHGCPHCDKMFAHFSNMNRHVRLVHKKMVVTHKYVNCNICNKIVQATSLKKHVA
jgi:ribosomal protein S27E